MKEVEDVIITQMPEKGLSNSKGVLSRPNHEAEQSGSILSNALLQY